MIIFNFENLIYVKLYSLLILSKIQKYKKNNVKALKNTKLVLFPGHTFSCRQDGPPSQRALSM